MLALEVGYRLVPLVDRHRGGELLGRIRAIRRKFAQDIGFLPPAVHVRDNLELRPGGYRVSLKGVTVGEGEVHPGQFLAIDPGGAQGSLAGTPTRDPAFGLPATWIPSAGRDAAQAAGFTVVDAGAVIATHLSHLLHRHAAALLGRAETQQMIEHFSRHTPKLADEVVPKLVPLAALQRVLQNLLDEGVPVRDLRSILEAIAEHSTRSQDPAELTAAVRVALGAAITQQVFGAASELQVLALDPELERLLVQQLASTGPAGAEAALEPGIAAAMLANVSAAARRQESLGVAPALLVGERLRAPLSRLLRRSVPQLRVLSRAEVPDSRNVRVSVTLGGNA